MYLSIFCICVFVNLYLDYEHPSVTITRTYLKNVFWPNIFVGASL